MSPSKLLIVHLPDGDTDYFDIVVGVQQGDTLTTHLFIIYLVYVLRMSIDSMKENGFNLAKKRSRWYPSQTVTDADYTDDIVLLANSLAQAKSLLHRLEGAAGNIGLYVNADKTEYICFNERSVVLWNWWICSPTYLRTTSTRD